MADSHRRGLVIYVVLAVVVVSIIGLYQTRTNRRLGQADGVSCQNRRILIANQAVVLQILERNITQFVRIAKTRQDRDYFQRSLAIVDQAQRRLATTPQCLP